MQLIAPLIRLEDHKIERMLRGAGPGMDKRSEAAKANKASGDWRHLALQSACLSASDLCLLPDKERTEERVALAVMDRWTNRHYRFHSAEHFLQIRQEVISRLQAYFVHEPCAGTLMVRFEPFTVYVEELDMELSQYFHLIYSEGESGECSYTVQKLVADRDGEAMELYRHMTTVFCRSAFGRLPSSIEALLPLGGGRIRWTPDESSWRESLDYLRLVKTMLAGGEQDAAMEDGRGMPSFAT
ncbi:hypothetical protein RB620_17985 [Paenibacillus sp. LHD-117]|uniref:hypothetical protein n=1 Tax=Paenibacillus sp. LHD-117 TaxID=3071412 RepID=UPI0027DF9964|nr:hypothetical protein [Paenibacillus sp. LHD-117]MDQ6421319.1 hypothetical protein [Paenibacillus sp. LHD-117]